MAADGTNYGKCGLSFDTYLGSSAHFFTFFLNHLSIKRLSFKLNLRLSFLKNIVKAVLGSSFVSVLPPV